MIRKNRERFSGRIVRKLKSQSAMMIHPQIIALLEHDPEKWKPVFG
jgi:hypothetical protein